MQARCDTFGENLVKAALPGSRWTYHHDTINIHISKIARHSCMTNGTETEDYFLRKLQETAIQLDNSLPLLSKHLKDYAPDVI